MRASWLCLLAACTAARPIDTTPVDLDPSDNRELESELVTSLTVYADSFKNGWQQGGWRATSVRQTSGTQAGAAALKVTLRGDPNTSGFAFDYDWTKPNIATATYTHVVVWIHPGPSVEPQEQALKIGVDNGSPWQPLKKYVPGGALVANKWQKARVPIAELDQKNGYHRIAILNDSKAEVVVSLDSVTVEQEVPAPIISAFTAVAPTIAAGESTTLSWTVANASSLALNGAAITGTSAQITPSATTTYTLVASGAGGTVQATTTVTVTAPPAPSADEHDIYIDALHADWADWSYDATVTKGAQIDVTIGAGSWGGLSLARVDDAGDPAMIAPNTYAAVSFDIKGTGSVSFSLDNGSAAVNVPLTTSWAATRITMITANTSGAPFHRLNFDAAPGTRFSVDNVVFEDGVAPPPPPPPVTTPALAYQPVTVSLQSGNQACNEYRWYDAQGELRTTAFLQAANGDGAAREFSYLHKDGARRVIHGEGGSGFEGFGWVMMHSRTTSQGSNSDPGTSSIVFTGKHHAIREFNTTIGINDQTGPASVKAKVQWFFATGRSHPIYAITFDASAQAADVFNGDSRSPYGYLRYDRTTPGAGSNTLSGIVWGDAYRFATTTTPITGNVGWTYNTANTIPFAYTFVTATDSELGLVETQAHAKTPSGNLAWDDAGTGVWKRAIPSYCHGKTSANDVDCRDHDNAQWNLPEDYWWPYQMNAYEIPYTTGVGKTAWGTSMGSIGMTQTERWGGGSITTYPYMSYSVSIVLGAHSTSANEAEILAQEANDAATITASRGSVVTQGPPGVGRPTATYPKAGYDPIFSTWRVQTAAGAATVTLASGARTLQNPIIRFAGASATPQVKLDGVMLAADADYFASSYNGELWVTFNRALAGNHTITVD